MNYLQKEKKKKKKKEKEKKEKEKTAHFVILSDSVAVQLTG
ncbi:hypothetical protein HJC23_009465 [Cyclotella cryptica]|uniref:Uncharacterized protein n=1 Tax=Cyclotella cryptica TaxID=29204 RepID=A0ABD3Q1R0_9STRA